MINIPAHNPKTYVLYEKKQYSAGKLKTMIL
jgi:hypothetical protein